MNFQELMDSYYFNEYESNEYRYKLLLEKMKKRDIVPVFGSGPVMYDDSMEELIPTLFDRLAVTTNVYDDLERLYKDPCIFAPAPEREMDSRILDARMSGRLKKPLIVKLQGTIMEPSNILENDRPFDDIYGYDPDRHIHHFVSEVSDIFRHFAPLFIGYRQDDERNITVFKPGRREYPNDWPSGFALLEMPDYEYKDSDNNSLDFISELGLRVIWYPHGRHECIGILLRQLAIDLGKIEDPTKSQEESAMTQGVAQQKQKVFIVHGHDNAAKQEMARTLENAGFEAIILHEQADTGLTIIEKIERYTDVNYAVVLYTECDLGRSKKDPVENEKNRARQNVVFEHGYLIGKLGRDHVSALVKGDVETPGDISGVVYTKMDEDGAWKMALARNMKAVGLNVDMNRFCR